MLGAEDRVLVLGQAIDQMLDQNRSLVTLLAVVEAALPGRNDPAVDTRNSIEAEDLQARPGRPLHGTIQVERAGASKQLKLRTLSCVDVEGGIDHRIGRV